MRIFSERLFETPECRAYFAVRIELSSHEATFGILRKKIPSRLERKIASVSLRKSVVEHPSIDEFQDVAQLVAGSEEVFRAVLHAH